MTGFTAFVPVLCKLNINLAADTFINQFAIILMAEHAF